MLNYLVLVGRLTSDPKIKEVENKNECNITLAVSRSYKNEEGAYETDFVNCTLTQGIAQQVSEWCKKGDVLSIKGRIETENNNLIIIAEKVSFLSTRKEED